ncbi:YhfH family protein [Bacillus lacus]|uniref:YhfH family protein n=1 Tax=Metabacillus lacus TaxID=1983721 RepID=A0A7X2M109_9BACI|nr:protein YhfH [Metabacillus lacus]MRX73549.1 YhfH family protein [Metabacillus lacus]
MIEKMTEFFKNLPAKKCASCGTDIEEQHECYGNNCDKCLNMGDL